MAEKETESRDSTRSYSRGTSHRIEYEPQKGGSLARAHDGRGLSPFSGSPFSLMRRLMDDMDRLFSGFGSSLWDPWTGESSFDRGIWSPQIETFRRGDKLVVRADLPGMTRDNVNVELEDDALIISGERLDEYKEERDDFYRSERNYGRFYRMIPLPEGIDPDDVRAEMKDGVLEVTMPAPKEPERRGRRIEIK